MTKTATDPKPAQFYTIVKNDGRAPVPPHLCLEKVGLIRYFVKKTPVKPTKRGFITKVKEIETRWAEVRRVDKGESFTVPCNLLFEEKVKAWEKMFELWQVHLDEKKAAVEENIKILKKELDDSRFARRRQRQEYLRALRVLRVKEVVSKVGSGIDVQAIKVPLRKKQKGVVRRSQRRFIN